MTNLSLASSVELISVHVPKTAGKNFGYKILPQIYRPDEILYDYQELSVKTLIDQGQLTNNIRAIHGHFPAVKYKDYFHQCQVVSWLRNPIMQLISAYFYWKVKKDVFYSNEHKYVVENNLSFSEFIELKCTKNFVSNYFFKDIRLSEFTFVGIQEFFNEDLQSCMKTLENQVLEVQIFNKNEYPEYKEEVTKILDNKKTMTRIVELNGKDLQVYNLALKMRCERKGLLNHLQMYEQVLENSRALLERFKVSGIKK